MDVPDVRRGLEIHFTLLEPLHFLVGQLLHVNHIFIILALEGVLLHAVDEDAGDEHDHQDGDYDNDYNLGIDWRLLALGTHLIFDGSFIHQVRLA